jgi:hypothetical protein
VISDKELWACANHFVRRHKEDAPIVAAMRADELLAAGDEEGVRTYRAIIRRIERLLAPPDGNLN